LELEYLFGEVRLEKYFGGIAKYVGVTIDLLIYAVKYYLGMEDKIL